MTRLADVSLFLAGLYLGIRGISAAYRVLDLWYTIRTEYPRVIRGILGWGLTIGAAAGLLGERRRPFLYGLVAFAAFYLSLFALRHLVLRKPARDSVRR